MLSPVARERLSRRSIVLEKSLDSFRSAAPAARAPSARPAGPTRKPASRLAATPAWPRGPGIFATSSARLLMPPPAVPAAWPVRVTASPSLCAGAVAAPMWAATVRPNCSICRWPFVSGPDHCERSALRCATKSPTLTIGLRRLRRVDLGVFPPHERRVADQRAEKIVGRDRPLGVRADEPGENPCQLGLAPLLPLRPRRRELRELHERQPAQFPRPEPEGPVGQGLPGR